MKLNIPRKILYRQNGEGWKMDGAFHPAGGASGDCRRIDTLHLSGRHDQWQTQEQRNQCNNNTSFTTSPNQCYRLKCFFLSTIYWSNSTPYQWGRCFAFLSLSSIPHWSLHLYLHSAKTQNYHLWLRFYLSRIWSASLSGAAVVLFLHIQYSWSAGERSSTFSHVWKCKLVNIVYLEFIVFSFSHILFAIVFPLLSPLSLKPAVL